jgi:hypothetical protein
MLVCLGFTSDAAIYLAIYAGIGSLDEIAYLDVDDVEFIIKHLNLPGGSTTFGTGDDDMTSPHAGYDVSSRAESNLKLCVFYLNHQERESVICAYCWWNYPSFGA